MMPWPNYLAFLLAALVVIASPGPDSLNSLALGLSRGRREGMAYALGVGMGCMTHTLWAVLGISAIVAASTVVFNAIKFAGVLYLLYLGIQALRDQGQVRLPTGDDAPRPAGSLRERFMQGVLTNALNPKVMLFFLAFLPQFVDTAAGPVALQMLLMGATFTALTTVAYVGLAWSAGRVGERLLRRPGLTLWLNRCTGVLFIALAARLALAERK
jgi:threonine/homoserine/homoserine lactone efflux protein